MCMEGTDISLKCKRKSLQAPRLERPENYCYRVILHHGCLKIMCKVISDSPSIYIRELVIRREIRSNARAGKCLVTWPGKPRNFSQSPKVLQYHILTFAITNSIIFSSSKNYISSVKWKFNNEVNAFR